MSMHERGERHHAMHASIVLQSEFWILEYAKRVLSLRCSLWDIFAFLSQIFPLKSEWLNGPMIELSVWSVGEDEQTCSFTWFHIKITTDFWLLCIWACWQVWKTAILLWWSSPPLGVGSTFKKVKISLSTFSNRVLQPRWPWIDSREGHWTTLVDEHFKVRKS